MSKLIITDITNIFGLVNEDKVRDYCGNDFEKLVEIELLATKIRDAESDYYPIIDGKVLPWSYPKEYVTKALELLKLFGLEYSFYTLPDREVFLLIIKIQKLIDNEQMYICIAPELNQCNSNEEQL